MAPEGTEDAAPLPPAAPYPPASISVSWVSVLLPTKPNPEEGPSLYRRGAPLPCRKGEVGTTWSGSMTQKVWSSAQGALIQEPKKLPVVRRKRKARAVGARLRLLFLLAVYPG